MKPSVWWVVSDTGVY